jgi:hypothetical protein
MEYDDAMNVYFRIGQAVALLFFSTLILNSQFMFLEREPGEVFPFFNWALFSNAPEVLVDYVLQLDEWNEAKMDPPCIFQNCRLPLKRFVHGYSYYYLTQQFANSCMQKKEDCEVLRKQVEEQSFAMRLRGKYALMRRTVNAVDYVLGRALPKYELVDRFEIGSKADDDSF